MSDETAQKAKPFDKGDALYQQRARAALPLLVRQAKAQQPITYADLAVELGMENPRNLNFVLGSIGRTLLRLSDDWETEIPPIECLVINQARGLPGEGVGVFIAKEDFKKMTKRQQRVVVEAQLQRIFAYPRWDAVLEALSLPPAQVDFSEVIRAAAARRGTGESEDHRRLKNYVAAHPEVVGLSAQTSAGDMEHVLPSGDKLDVLFRVRRDWIAVEVKSRISDDADLTRGMFQCVKYKAVLEAYLLSIGKAANVRILLATSRDLPAWLIPLKNILGVECLVVQEPPPNGVTISPGQESITGKTRLV